MSEKELQDLIVEYLRRKGYLVLRINPGRRGNVQSVRWWDGYMDGGTAGVADLLAFAPNGDRWAIECKQPGQLLRPEQEAFKLSWLHKGGLWITASSLDDVEHWNL